MADFQAVKALVEEIEELAGSQTATQTPRPDDHKRPEAQITASPSSYEAKMVELRIQLEEELRLACLDTLAPARPVDDLLDDHQLAMARPFVTALSDITEGRPSDHKELLQRVNDFRESLGVAAFRKKKGPWVPTVIKHPLDRAPSLDTLRKSTPDDVKLPYIPDFVKLRDRVCPPKGRPAPPKQREPGGADHDKIVSDGMAAGDEGDPKKRESPLPKEERPKEKQPKRKQPDLIGPPGSGRGQQEPPYKKTRAN